MWLDFNFFRVTDRLTDKTDCLTPLRACARGVKNCLGGLLARLMQVLDTTDGLVKLTRFAR